MRGLENPRSRPIYKFYNLTEEEIKIVVGE
jgi:hypothetical protein